MSNDSDWKDKNLPVSNFIGATPSSDTNELDVTLKKIIEMYATVDSEELIPQIKAIIVTKEQEAYKKGYITGSADDILRPHKPPQYSAPKGFGQLKGDI